MTRPSTRDAGQRATRRAAASILIGSTILASCARSDFAGSDPEEDLRRSVIEAAQRELAESRRFPTPVVTEQVPSSERLGIRPEIMPEVERMAGPRANEITPLPAGIDLLGQPTRTVTLDLAACIRAAAANNLAVQFARLGPGVAEAQVVAAEAAFDWTAFGNVQYNNTDSPRPASSFATRDANNAEQSQRFAGTAGLRRTLASGGRLTVQHEGSWTDIYSPGVISTPNPAEQVSFTVQYDQPLLRGFGTEVSQAEIRVARNAERNSVQTLRRDLTRILTDTERAYWQLHQAHRDVLILQRLLERGERVRDQLRERARIDANQAQIADAVARVERRRSDVLRAQTQLRLASDRLKALINDPELPVGSEIVLVPADGPVEAPVRFSVLESLTSAIRLRPEIQSAILAIDDASIRQVVADNARLPDLNLRLQAEWSNLDGEIEDAYGSVFNQRFVDYLVAVAVEMPIGNRRAEADFSRRRLERLQSVLAYRNTLQQVVGEVKSALDRVSLNYRLISQTRDSRLAAAEVLRVLLVENEIRRGLTVDTLDLQLNREESLAQAEREEVAALVDYNVALAELFSAMGTTLERNRVQFIVPSAGDVLWRDPPAMASPRTPALTPLSAQELAAEQVQRVESADSTPAPAPAATPTETAPSPPPAPPPAPSPLPPPAPPQPAPPQPAP
jgi:outer membrane protein TolC